jgi:predicted lysophospholipase L1 biosynthesis ABC-type transport system permease subunit
VKQNDLGDQHANGAVYFPYAKYSGSNFTIALRTAQAPEGAGSALRATVLRLDPELPLHDLKAMTARVSDSLASRRVPLLLAGVFAAVALVLAAVGIYGVLAYSVLQRQREIGVRMALGALPEQILRQFLGLGGRMLAIGIPLGLLGAWLAGRTMTSLLFGVEPANPLVLGGTALLLTAVALVACLLPSRRAARVSPMEALRST